MRGDFFKEKDWKLNFFGLLTFIALTIAFSTHVLTVQAVTGNPSVPKGAIVVDGIFAPPNIKMKPGGSGGNTGVVLGPSDQNNGVPFSEVVLSGSQNAVSIWADDKYKMDFSKSFNGREYVNFGTSQADGFAFVMQNDDKKTTAITNALANTDGQNLGVYGGSGSYGAFWNVTTPESFAIKNSIAIEFDLYANNNGGSMYDADFPKVPHIAYSFPGNLAKGYTPVGSNWQGIIGTGAVAKIHHYNPQVLNGVVGDNIQDGTWYEFRYDFDKATSSFTYYLLNPLTGVKTQTFSIPWADLSSELKLSANANKAYWGFTGSNGAANGQVKFVFTQVPVDLDAGVKNDVIDNAASIVDTNNSEEYQQNMPAAEYGDQVTLKSSFSLKAGETSLAVNNWETTINPEVFDLAKPITEVKAVTDNVAVSGSATVDSATGKVQLVFPDLKIAPGKTVDFQYTVQTKAGGKTTKTVFSSLFHTTEIGNNTAKSFPSNPVPFWVFMDSPTKLAWEQNSTEQNKSISLDKSETTQDYPGKFLWSDTDKNEKLQFYLKKGSEMIQKLSQVSTSGTTDFQEAAFTIPKDKISYGENDFTIEAYHLDRNSKEVKEAATLNLKIIVSGKLIFQSAPNELKWTNRLAGDSKGTLSRDSGNTMRLSIMDSREKDHNWSLGVTAKASTNMPFELVWQGKNEAEKQTITDKPLTVMNSSNVPANNYVYSEEWGETEGVLLQSKEYMHVGDYSGKVIVHWNLYDTESPE
ncbi:lectin-like domain-containing protein [Enterococcus malodoratus]|uniref:WxL domain-containing protein n=1 Tax=Enterococcus malodoratus ATCC 43197 TaxID=1158601 RepID=R2NLN0_9ENTE|nr:hypothetical protein [Enterococcus malodoratus]EOH71888.1 hypothetical protein UAI_04172 [Enterococcus malodoratus ATCC 43197]EOT70088.1 hypothetical protein I585_01567 [Enterococcus malodoratus ATCC 43197]OJG66291.1 hypothetical protein RV07_GL000084 [Enterococcus malodoratus]SPW74789.1 Leucine-rich repeat (LRR) protein [Enterococcus malodoratus]STD65299.1 Leucine-rich repeat (LRR) protein [Enterococcus malodoratus]